MQLSGLMLVLVMTHVTVLIEVAGPAACELIRKRLSATNAIRARKIARTPDILNASERSYLYIQFIGN